MILKVVRMVLLIAMAVVTGKLLWIWIPTALGHVGSESEEWMGWIFTLVALPLLAMLATAFVALWLVGRGRRG